MNKYIKLALITGLGIVYMASLGSLALAQNYLTGSVLNTSAGNPVLLSAKTTLLTEKVNFRVTKPNGLVVTMSSDLNSNGEAKILLDGYHTSEAGHYDLEVTQGDNLTNNVGFNVLPGLVDASKSQVELATAMADLNKNIKGKVTLEDKYGNVVKGHQVKIISSRNADVISVTDGVTDKNGNVDFNISSLTAGVSYISVLDMTDNIVLNNRVKIIFANNLDDIAGIGGNLIPQAMAKTTTTTGSFYAFDLSGFPNNIQPNQNISFTVKAVDQNGNVVQNYTGTVRFSSNGNNSSAVSLPSNYTFLASDLGEHKFDLGLSFTTSGTYTIIANDLSDKFKQGQKKITVGQSGLAGSSTPSSTQQIIVITPSAGTYSQATQTISGTTVSNYQVEIFDNNQSLGKVTAGVDGKFTFQTQPLSDGNHEIYVNAIDPISQQVKSTSKKVKIIIDTIPPKIDQLDIKPSGKIKPGGIITITVHSEKNLQQAVALFNYNIVPLKPTTADPTIYVGQIAAPQQSGDYPVDINLVDELGNDATFSKQANVTVSGTSAKATSNVPATGDSTKGITPAPKTTGTTTSKTDQKGFPSTVTGLVAYGADHRVTLVWDTATDKQKIKNYKVYFGHDLKNLDHNISTKDASTTWYVPNLDNGKEYFFTVTAVDDQGNESVNKSEMVSGIPFVLEVNNALNVNSNVKPLPTPNLHAAAYNGPLPSQTPKTGPALFGVLLAAGALGTFFTKKK